MIKIKPCPMCGSPVVIDSTGAVECYGRDWQTLSIECTRTIDKNCGMGLSLCADFFYVKNNPETTLIEAWNRL